MKSIILRRRILSKLAQQATTSAESGSPATPAPTTPAAPPATAGSPPSFIASAKYPSLYKAFSIEAANIIDQFSSYLNKCIFYASNGQHSMEKLFQIGFNFSTTSIPSNLKDAKDLKHLMLFGQEVFKILYNSGNTYNAQLNKSEYLSKINPLIQSSNLNVISASNPNGELYMKMGGDIKTNLLNLLKKLLSIAPTK